MLCYPADPFLVPLAASFADALAPDPPALAERLEEEESSEFIGRVLQASPSHGEFLNIEREDDKWNGEGERYAEEKSGDPAQRKVVLTLGFREYGDPEGEEGCHER